ncbi:MAG: FKBP-type peptidyl-prolyl cis-trans isomerase [Rhizomicrobium sp.]|jgi:FKBP-type peptidyl-prolyl cis-trans isomerase
MSRLGAFVVAGFTLFAASAHAADSSLSAQANAAFLAANSQKPGVVVRPSGLQYRILTSGYGKRPASVDSVTVYYTGTLINGTRFDATEAGLPATFVANQLIPGWTEALELMREGDHWQIVIPPNLGYGNRGAGDGAIPPNQTLVFDLELVKVTPPKKDEQDQDQNGGSQ